MKQRGLLPRRSLEHEPGVAGPESGGIGTREAHRMMRVAAGITATGIIGWLLLEALKILMVPITAWVMGLLAMALKIVLVTAALLAAVGVGVFVYRRSRRARQEV